MDTFYASVTTFSFTLLGLWWGVLQIRHNEWLHDRAKRRMANSVYIALFVPGIMSLASQIAPGTPLVWRIVFMIASVGGIIATLFLTLAMGEHGRRGFFYRVGRWISVVLYAFIFFTALLPTAYAAIGVTGLQAEALWLTILVFLGVMLAWEGVMEPTEEIKP